MSQRWGKIALIFLGPILLGATCNNVVSEMVREDDLRRYLTGHGWTYADFPKELLGTGSIVSITENEGLRRRGMVDSCVPLSAIQRKTGAASLPEFKKNYGISAKGFLRFIDVAKVGPAFDQVTRVQVTMETVSEETLDELILMQWLERNRPRMDLTCRRYFEHPNVFVITEALKVGGYRYTFLDKSSAGIELTAEKLKGYMDIGADVKYSFTADGSLVVDKPLYIAFRSAAYASSEDIPRVSAEGAVTIMRRYHEARPLD